MENCLAFSFSPSFSLCVCFHFSSCTQHCQLCSRFLLNSKLKIPFFQHYIRYCCQSSSCLIAMAKFMSEKKMPPEYKLLQNMFSHHQYYHQPKLLFLLVNHGSECVWDFVEVLLVLLLLLLSYKRYCRLLCTPHSLKRF